MTRFPAPTNVEAEAVSSSKLKVAWNASDGATAYEVFANNVYRGTTTDTELTINGLKANTGYTIFVLAITKTGDAINEVSAASDDAEATTAAPTGAVLTGAEFAGPGENLVLTYGLNGVSDDVFGEDITFTYDAEKLEFIGVETKDESKFQVAGYDGDTPGKVRVIGAHFGSAQSEPNGQLLQLTFKVKADANATTMVTVTDLIVADGDSTERTLDGASFQVTISTVDRTALNNLIAEAKGVHDAAVEGTAIGKYPVGSKAVLLAAIQAAEAVASKAGATQDELETAVTALNEALTAFRNAIIKPAPGDHNSDDRISIGDLALMAKHYGVKIGDEGWQAAQPFDLVADDEINILDLAALARKILDWQ
ncbi:cohesin domain-containing protein [Paenibacillus phyllosphaerae]|uniref:cohesin domain-containing protein n=1 Tax=Paenibacillus phyllosphaerae TaxID=274593 RepID=UPI001FE5E429|nr:cohesin domain-containing protein [Paenibacillus phyllosphaerae]